MKQVPESDDDILRWPQVQPLTGAPHRSTVNRRERKGTFPKRIRLGPNSVGWRRGDIKKWIAERMADETTVPRPGQKKKTA